MKKIIFACLAALFTLISCSGDLKDVNGKWKTSELVYKGETIQLVDSDLLIEKAGNDSVMIYGYSGVNRFSGEVKISKDSIECGDGLAMTKMMGEPISQNFEDKFIEVFMHSKEYSLENDILIIKNEKNNSFIKFTKIK